MSSGKQRKIQTFSVLIKTEMAKIDIDGNESVASIYPTKQNLLIVQDLWQAYYQILLIIWQKKLVKELDIKIVIVFLNSAKGQFDKI